MIPPVLARCDFCGLEFDPACQETSCQSCPLNSPCGKAACPRCGYPLLPEPRLFAWVRTLRQKIQAAAQ